MGNTGGGGGTGFWTLAAAFFKIYLFSILFLFVSIIIVIFFKDMYKYNYIDFLIFLNFFVWGKGGCWDVGMFLK